jgi:hypothetical protein
MQIGRNNDRVFNGGYDSVAQADLVSTWRQQDEITTTTLVEMSIARLRIETLLSETLVFSDSQILDGAMFMILLSDNHLNALSRGEGKPLPIEIRARAPRLDASLWRTYIGPSGPKMFLPSAFTGGQEVSAALASASAPRVNGVPGVVELLRASGVEPSELDLAEAAWTKLVELQGRDIIPVRQWSSTLADHLPRAAEYWTSNQLKSDLLQTAEGVRVLDEVVAIGDDRSAIYRLHSSAVLSAGADEDLQADLAWIRLWYNELYRRAQAFQHASDYRGADEGLFDPTTVRQVFERDDADHLVDVQLPAGTLTYLSQLSVQGWHGFQEGHRGHLRKWWDNGDIDALRRVADGLAKDAQEAGFEVGPSNQSITTFSPKATVSLLAKVGGAVGTIPLDPTLTGFSVGAAVVLFQSIVEWLCSRSSKSSIVQVTSYFDDAR